MPITKFSPKSAPGAEEIEFFRENGYLYVEQLYSYETELRPILENIFELIGMLAESYEIPLGTRQFTPTGFDQGLQQMIRHHRPAVGVLYNAVKKLPHYVRLAASPKHDAYSRALLSSTFVGFANRGYGIRMDNPGEDEYSTQLHQDYVSQLCSQNCVVSWSPLRDVTPEMGPVVLYPGSHRSGVYRIVKAQGGSRGQVIDGADALAGRFERLAPEVPISDCLFMHALLLHESSPNRSTQTRWSMISRYFDFTDHSGRAIQWRGGLQEGNAFEAIHPELTRTA